MKNALIKLLNRPKVLIPAALIVAVIIGAASFGSIGRAPEVALSPGALPTATGSQSADNSIDLAFPVSGRLASVSVVLGSPVSQGDLLASLDAGDALGVVNQAKGALELAKAQLAALNVQYANTQAQQEVLVGNAYRTLLSSDLTAVAHKTDSDRSNLVIDNSQIPQVSGTYTCDKEGSYEIYTYRSGSSESSSGYAFNLKGLEGWGMGNVTYYTPQALGSCGLFIQFPVGYHSDAVNWIVEIPNTRAASYAANKNAYDLAVATRDQVLAQLATSLGGSSVGDTGTAQAAVDAATGAYQAALAAYRNKLIVAPMDSVVTFVDSHLKVGQAVAANKTVITVTKK